MNALLHFNRYIVRLYSGRGQRERERETDRQTDRRTYRQTDRHTWAGKSLDTIYI